VTLQLTAMDLINVQRFVSSAGIGTEVRVMTQVYTTYYLQFVIVRFIV